MPITNKMSIAILCVLAVAGAALVCAAGAVNEDAQAGQVPKKPQAVRPPARPDAGPALKDLAWMAGYWSGEHKGIRMEECWLPPAGGMMLGLHRDVIAADRVFFEYLRIERAGKDIVYQASPRGREPTPFKLVSAVEGRAVFENPEHDFPQRIIYALDDDGNLCASIEGERNGETVRREWTWSRDNLTDTGESEEAPGGNPKWQPRKK